MLFFSATAFLCGETLRYALIAFQLIQRAERGQSRAAGENTARGALNVARRQRLDLGDDPIEIEQLTAIMQIFGLLFGAGDHRFTTN